MRKGTCNKHRENKDSLELYITSCVVEFLSNKTNAEVVVTDVLNYYEKRTDETNLKNINSKIASILKEVGKLTDAFINTQNPLLRNSIEEKMNDYESLLNDLYKQQSQLELERGYCLSKKDLIDFIELLIEGDKNDKDFQKKIIDNLVKQVYVSDDDTVVYFNIRGSSDMETENIDLETANKVKNGLLGVRTQLPIPCQISSVLLCAMRNFFIFCSVRNRAFEICLVGELCFRGSCRNIFRIARRRSCPRLGIC